MAQNTKAIEAARAAAQRKRSEKVDGKVPIFAAWIDKVGVDFLVKRLGVSKWTVYSWRRKSLGLSQGALPRTTLLQRIITLAKGELSAVDIYPPER